MYIRYKWFREHVAFFQIFKFEPPLVNQKWAPMIKRQLGLIWHIGNGGLFKGRLLKICSSRMGVHSQRRAYSRGAI